MIEHIKLQRQSVETEPQETAIRSNTFKGDSIYVPLRLSFRLE